MEGMKRLIRKWGWLCLILVTAVICSIYSFEIFDIGKKSVEEEDIAKEKRESSIENSDMEAEATGAEELERGYDLPVADDDRIQAEADCIEVLGLLSDIYENADKGGASRDAVPDALIADMQERVTEHGYSVTTSMAYANMGNYEAVDAFLKDCQAGKHSSAVIYEILTDGGIGRKNYTFDGKDMYILTAKASWDEESNPRISYISYARINEWEYTEKGWFAYEVCVPQPPQVTEVFNGNCMVRVLPMKEEYREVSEKYLRPLTYQGNNLLCSDWDEQHMENLDYNGMYEYLYMMKYQERFPYQDYPNGIPREEFEAVITQYLPITPEQLQNYAVFHQDSQTYEWNRLGCGNYAPNDFGTALPEVCDIQKNDDGTMTITVDAVCELSGNDSVMRHQLTVQMLDDGSIRYLKNQILDDGLSHIPEYQYRIKGNGR